MGSEGLDIFTATAVTCRHLKLIVTCYESIVKAVVFLAVRYGCESWTIKNAKHLRIDAFELWCWRKLLRIPWTARRSKQSILKEINPEHSLEGLMLKLSLPDAKSRLIGKTPNAYRERLKAKGEGGGKKMVREHQQLNAREFEQTPGDSGGQRRLACCSPWGRKELDTT